MRPRSPLRRWTVLAVVLVGSLGACAEEAPAPAEGEGAAPAAAPPAADADAVRAPDGGDDPDPVASSPPLPELLDALFVPGGPRPLLTPCGTDRVLTVAGPDAAAELERRVRLERPGVDEPVRVTVRGAAGEGVFRLEEVVRVHRADDCPEAPADRPLDRTAWQLSGLPEPDEAVRAAGAWLRLDSETGAIEGSTGCRTLVGRHDRNVTGLRFSGLDPRVAACPRDEVHHAFLDALARTGSYRIVADTLVLLGETGPLATFRAPEP